MVATTFSHSAESLEAAHYIVHDLTGIRVEIANDEIVLNSHTACGTGIEKLRDVLHPF